MNPNILTIVMVAIGVSYTAICFAASANPLLHFDASDKSSIQSHDGSVQVWRAKVGNGLLHSVEGSAPSYDPKRNAINFNGVSNYLIFSKAPEMRLGNTAIWIVGSLKSTSPNQYFFGAQPNARFDLKTDNTQFMIELGSEGHTPKRGAPLDTSVHLFELSHFLDPNMKGQILPGSFFVDGQSHGKPFSKDTNELSKTLHLGSKNATEGFLDGDIFEILIFDREPSPDEAFALREHLAKKWNINLVQTRPLNVPTLEGIPITPEQIYGSFGIYNESPESPDGRRVAYIIFDTPPTQDRPMAPFSIWVADRDFKNHHLLKKAEIMTNNHNGAFLQWIDDNLIAYCGGHLTRNPDGSKTNRAVYVIDSKTGNIKFGPFTNGFLGDNSKRGRILITVDEDGSNLGERGLYEVDTLTGNIKCLFKITDFSEYSNRFSWKGFKPKARNWMVTHANYSTSGEKISFEVAPGGGVSLLFTCNADGSDLHFWGKDKPLHEQWFDDDTLCGADEITNDGYPDNLFLRRWNLQREVIETLAGPVNHIAISPNRQFFAGESFYRSNPVALWVYERGNTTPIAKIDAGNSELIWGDTGHVNPSFSRDGKRLYFHRGTEDRRKVPCYVDLSIPDK